MHLRGCLSQQWTRSSIASIIILGTHLSAVSSLISNNKGWGRGWGLDHAPYLPSDVMDNYACILYYKLLIFASWTCSPKCMAIKILSWEESSPKYATEFVAVGRKLLVVSNKEDRIRVGLSFTRHYMYILTG